MSWLTEKRAPAADGAAPGGALAGAAVVGQVWRELAGPVYPAMAGIGTTALWQPEAMIEILGVAVIPDERLTPPGASIAGVQED